MEMKPALRPQLTKDEALRYLSTFHIVNYPVKLLGIRGYYKKTMGNPLTNNIGIYDDALFVISDNVFKSFNFNTDPSRMIDNVAVLKPGGPYLYKKGLHGVHHIDMNNPKDKADYDTLIKTGKDLPSRPLTYWAFRQYGNVTVLRNNIPVTDSPMHRFWIDIHRGGYNTTSSLGCQTVYPDQWDECFALAMAEMNKAKQVLIPYLLIEF